MTAPEPTPHAPISDNERGSAGPDGTERHTTGPQEAETVLGRPQLPGPSAPPQVQVYGLSFTGDSREYFRIWIVNVALSVVTLGLYTPWARVRTRQYFYGHTWLDGHNFEYTANPVALLRGYLIVAAFSLLYYVSVNFPFDGSGWVIGGLAVLFVAVYPWLVRQSMRFLARSTTHRGLTFGFSGTLGASYVNYGLANVAAGLSGGLALPWAQFRQRQYQVQGLHYGQARGHFRGDVGRFYTLTLQAIGLTVGLGLALLILGGVGAVLIGGTDLNRSSVGLVIGGGLAYAALLLAYGAIGVWLRGAIMQYVLSNVELGGVVRLGASFSMTQLVWITLSNYVLSVLTLGLLLPWAAIRRTRFLLEHVHVRAIAPLDDFRAAQTRPESALGEAATELLDINIGF